MLAVDLLTLAIKLIEKHDAINECGEYARKLLDRAWKKPDLIIEDSMVKINLRAYSWFVSDRS